MLCHPSAMNSQQSINILKRQADTARQLTQVPSGSPEFTCWKRDTEVAIEKIFGRESRNLADFQAVRYTLSMWISGMPDSDFQKAYCRGLGEAIAVLGSMVHEIEEYGLGDHAPEDVPDHLTLIEKLCLRFHASARQLQQRHANRDTITIEDEYDVQDLLHALLRVHFDDIRAEEWTPSYAGSSSRVDFLLKAEQIVIEVKKTRASLKARELGEQLIIDRARYEAHPDCRTLVCFVYDPEGRIGNPVGIERDLEQHGGALRTRVIIAPRS